MAVATRDVGADGIEPTMMFTGADVTLEPPSWYYARAVNV